MQLYYSIIYRSVWDKYFLNEIKCENPFTMLTEERLVHEHVLKRKSSNFELDGLDNQRVD